MKLAPLIILLFINSIVGYTQEAKPKGSEDSITTSNNLSDEVRNQLSEDLFLLATPNKYEASINDTIIIVYEIYTQFRLPSYAQIVIVRLPIYKDFAIIDTTTYWKIKFEHNRGIRYYNNYKIGQVREEKLKPEKRGELTITPLELSFRLPNEKLKKTTWVNVESKEIKILVY
jgi:hypothetical protein